MVRDFEEDKLEFGSAIESGSAQINEDDSLDPLPLDSYARALIVDDQNFNIVAIKAQIEALGVMPDVAVSGAEALNLVKLRLQDIRLGQAKMYELILLDYCMPGMDGLQTAEAIRASIYEHI